MSATAPTVPSPTGNSENETPEQDRLLEQYKTYLDTIDHSAEKRMQIHQFFVGIHSLLGTLFGYLATSDKYAMDDIVFFLFVLAVVGFSFSHVWFLWVTSYTAVNSAKWKVIYDMEKKLPYQPFQAEWSGKGKLKEIKSKTPPIKHFSWLLQSKKSQRYYSASDTDGALPQLFGVIYILLGLYTGIYGLHSNWSDILSFLTNIWHLCLEWVGVLIVIFLVLLVIALRLFKESE